jgi:hypothetical protein
VRGLLLRRIFFLNFLCYEVFAKQKKKKCSEHYYLPLASSLTLVLPAPLSRVPRRYLSLIDNEITDLHETVFNGHMNLE